MLKPFWLDKNFWIIIVTAVLAILNEVLGFNVPSEAVWTVVIAILGYVFKDAATEIAIKTAAIKKEGYAAAVKKFKDE